MVFLLHEWKKKKRFNAARWIRRGWIGSNDDSVGRVFLTRAFLFEFFVAGEVCGRFERTIRARRIKSLFDSIYMDYDTITTKMEKKKDTRRKLDLGLVGSIIVPIFKDYNAIADYLAWKNIYYSERTGVYV